MSRTKEKKLPTLDELFEETKKQEQIIDKIKIKEGKEKKQTFDDVISLIELDGFSSIKTHSMMYLAYKMDRLVIYVNDKEYGKHNIHKIPIEAILNKKVKEASVFWGDGGAILSCLSYDSIIELMEQDRLNGIVLHY